MPIAQPHRPAAEPALLGGPGPAPQWTRPPEDELSMMQADSERLLLMTMQASLSLVGFGFTIYQIFSDAAAKAGVVRASLMANRVGICLLSLGLILLAGGLWANTRTRRVLKARRAELVDRGLLSPTDRPPLSPVFVVASLLLVLTVTILGVILARFLG